MHSVIHSSVLSNHPISCFGQDVKDKQCLSLVEKFQKHVYAMLAAAQQPPPDRAPLVDVTVDNSANTSHVAKHSSTTASTEDNKENVRRGTGDNEVTFAATLD